MDEPIGNSDPVEDLLAACLSQPEEEWESAIDAAGRSNPEHAEALRRRFALIAGTLPAATDALPERLGGFRLRHRIGEGGMGIVWAAHDESLGRDVALKLVRPELVYFDASRERFQREILAIAKLQHPGIVPVYSVGEENGLPFYAMELVRGVALDQVVSALADRSPTDVTGADVQKVLEDRIGEPVDAAVFPGSWAAVCARFVRQAADAIAHAHAHGVMHRDLKPSNLMVRADGVVQVLDFGLAVVAGTSGLTRTGGQVGSPPYMAPEQLDDLPVDERTDVYALGVTMYELLTLSCPFLRDTGETTRRAVIAGDCPPARTVHAGLSWELDTICTVAMDIDPARRYRTAAALRDDLDRAQSHRPIVARRPGAMLRLRRWTQRRPALATGLVLGFLLAAGTPTALLLQQQAANIVLRGALDEVDMLADQHIARRLRVQEEELYPALPSRANAMKFWLREADALMARLPAHHAVLARLRQRAEMYTQVDRDADADARAVTEGQIAELMPHRRDLEELEASARRDTMLRELDRTVAELERQLVDRMTWRFADVKDAWWNDELTQLVQSIEELRPLREAVDGRLRQATSILEQTIEDHRDAWHAAIGRVAADARFGDFLLEERVGLVPLGPDPRSDLEEFAWALSGSIPTRSPTTGALEFAEDAAIVLALVPGGHCRIGARLPVDDEEDGIDHVDSMAFEVEAPVLTAELEPFFVSKFEITQDQWMTVMRENPSLAKPGDVLEPDGEVTGRHPVSNASWLDCETLAQRLGLEMPTEVQWEYAARAGTTTRWWTGALPSSVGGAVNLCDVTIQRRGIQVPVIETDIDDGHLQTAAVGSFAANRFGLYDTMGNVTEWCRDGFVLYANAVPGPVDGLLAPPTGEMRSARGGHWAAGRRNVRSSSRLGLDPQMRDSTLGVRLVLR